LGEFPKSDLKKGKLSEAYYDLIKKVKQGYENTITPSDLKYAVSKRAPQFSGYG